MLANILWRLAWQQRREMSLIRSLGFSAWTPVLYLTAQALAIVLPGSLLGVLAAQTVGKAVIQHIAGFGLDTSFEFSAVLSAGVLSLAIMLLGTAIPMAWLRRFDLAELLRSE
jgi:ABC-type antimicrobial peptide transport system permease subunit